MIINRVTTHCKCHNYCSDDVFCAFCGGFRTSRVWHTPVCRDGTGNRSFNLPFNHNKSGVTTLRERQDNLLLIATDELLFLVANGGRNRGIEVRKSSDPSEVIKHNELSTLSYSFAVVARPYLCVITNDAKKIKLFDYLAMTFVDDLEGIPNTKWFVPFENEEWSSLALGTEKDITCLFITRKGKVIKSSFKVQKPIRAISGTASEDNLFVLVTTEDELAMFHVGSEGQVKQISNPITFNASCAGIPVHADGKIYFFYINTAEHSLRLKVLSDARDFAEEKEWIVNDPDLVCSALEMRPIISGTKIVMGVSNSIKVVDIDCDQDGPIEARTFALEGNKGHLPPQTYWLCIGGFLYFMTDERCLYKINLDKKPLIEILEYKAANPSTAGGPYSLLFNGHDLFAFNREVILRFSESMEEVDYDE